MKKLAIVFAVGAAALLGGSAANAADNSVKAQAATGVSQSSTDFSSRNRGHRYSRGYGRSYAYAPRRGYYGASQPYYGGSGYGYGGPGYGGGYGGPGYGGGYGYGGPSVSFGFGGGRGW
jgi:hypothetical protein